MASRSFSLLTALCLALCLLLPQCLAHNIQMRAHSQECFHETLHKDDRMTVTFQVGDREFGGSGNLDIDFWVRVPDCFFRLRNRLSFKADRADEKPCNAPTQNKPANNLSSSPTDPRRITSIRSLYALRLLRRPLLHRQIRRQIRLLLQQRTLVRNLKRSLLQRARHCLRRRVGKQRRPA